MNRTLLAGLCAAAVFVACTVSFAQAKAVAIRFSPLPERVATADAVVTGKVTAIEEKTVSAEPFPKAPNKADYLIAVVKIGDDVLGAKGLTHVKVGFIKPPEGKPLIRPGGYRPVQLAVDQEGLFFLTKHPTESFYLLPGYNSFVSKANNDDFEKEVARTKECAKLLADPKASLKSKDAGERELTAEMLVARYRAYRGPNQKTEAVAAEESKLILTALAEADWSKAPTQGAMTPQMAFGQLGATDKDGWVWKPAPNAPATAYQDAAKAWLKSNADTYRVQRFVEDKKDK